MTNDRHYVLTDETHPENPRLHRIRATRDLPRHSVREGDLGGWIEKEANLSGNGRVSGNARLELPQHLLMVGPLGSESVTATLARTAEGHLLAVGCWHGDIDGLAAEVERRSRDWDADEATRARWRAEYAALEMLARARISMWTDEGAAATTEEDSDD